MGIALDVSPNTSFQRSLFLARSLGTFHLCNASKNSFAPVGLKFLLDRIASLTKSDMFKPEMVSPSIFTCPVLSHVITSGFAFKRDKSAMALRHMVQGIGSTTSASDNCDSARCSSFLTGLGVSFCRLSNLSLSGQNVRSQAHVFGCQLMAVDHQVPIGSARSIAKRFHEVVGTSRKHLFRQR